MKIKFLKPFRLYNPIGDDMMIAEGAIENMEKEDYAQWLIDNGFAEEVRESGWWRPKNGDRYYFIDGSGYIKYDTWRNGFWEVDRYKMGNVFKTEEATKRCRAYLEAIATVRQDEGVIDLQEVRERCETGSEHDDVYVYTIAYDFYERKLVVISSFDCMSANGIWFDTMDHADTSLNKHHDEWKIIANYDWSRE